MDKRSTSMQVSLWAILFAWMLLVGQGTAQVAESHETDTVPIDQLEINKAALQAGSDNAAHLMLTSDDPLTRDELLTILSDPTQVQAHIAICKALSTLRVEGNGIWQKEDLVEPLLSLLSDLNATSATSIPEALLIFDYKTIGNTLETMAKDRDWPEVVRLNALQALSLQPNKQAVVTILALADDPVEAVAGRAREILEYLGLTGDRSRIARELEVKGMDEFLWEWLIQQESRARDLRKESDFWQDLAIKTLDRLYDALTKDTDRAQLWVENLKAAQASRKIWALEKVEDWRMAPRLDDSPLPTDLTPLLTAMLSDPVDAIRSEVAELLPFLPQVEYVNPLLQQMKQESVGAIRLKQFVALGVALQVDPQKILPIQRQHTLEWAAKFLNQEDPEAVRKAAVVIRKLLEKNNLVPDYAERTLRSLVLRVEQLSPDSPLKTDLLTQMVTLCGERSRVRAKAIEIYRPVFIEALQDPIVAVRVQGVEGLICIDPVAAFQRFKTEMISDPEPTLRAKVIGLAESQGRAEDLQWLMQRASTGEDREAVAKAITAILANSGMDVIRDGVASLMPDPGAMGVNGSQWQSILQHAYRTAESAGDLALVQDYGAELLRLHLAEGRMEESVTLLVAALKGRDLDPKGGYAIHLGRFCNDPNHQEVGLTLAEAVNVKIDTRISRPNWEHLIQTIPPSSSSGKTQPSAEQAVEPQPTDNLGNS